MQHLNSEQFAAVQAPDGPLLVLAAAGTGKTRTLVYRVAYLVERGINPDRILLLTFTNRAANEMLDRARVLVGPGISGVWGGTFHHMSNRILRRHAPALGFNHDFTILDRDDSKTLVSNCVKDLDLASKEFPKSDVLLGIFSAAANTGSSVQKIAGERFRDSDIDPDKIAHVHDRYTNHKNKLGAMDFDDLLSNCLKLFREKTEVLARYQEQFLHVLVDEYQDTNAIQAELVDRIVAKNRNVLVVGDDFQSIYSWRGADFRNIMSFPKRYIDARIYKLETNYRSVPEILEVANACIAGNPEQYQKTLRAVRQGHRKPTVLRMRDGGEQARSVVEQIRNMCRSGYRMSDISILYRAHYHAMELQMELTREKIPYIITSGVRFFEQAHIKDVCSILRVLENPADEMAFSRLLGFLPGIGPRSVQKLWSGLGGKFDASDAVQRAKLKSIMKPGSRAAWDAIEPVLAAYRDEHLDEDGGEVIYRFVDTFYGRHAANVFDDPDRRLDDIRELILYTSKFATVQEFLSDIALLTNLDAEVENFKTDEQNAVRLSTVHQAKGLEWPVVMILWMSEGMFPSARSMEESDSGEAEERRLFYVAVTRAKDELCMCVPELRRTRDGGVMYYTPSRFIDEIPRNLINEVRTGFI
ncbi:MAG: ATP-dependent helicase [Kiritimatiellae bacterium]|nr:ATP-dependent helicase [Kiritimatiellia bacterium]MDD5523326.1 ATP-dependent helicase [Kiritimatiellia bacterium]